MPHRFLGRSISGPFTIPSGIVMTDAASIGRLARGIPELGVLTTKSIGLKQREGYKEPILAEPSPGTFINAVGLANPGVEVFAEKLARQRIPEDRFLLASIFGNAPGEIRSIAGRLKDRSEEHNV